MGSDASYSQAVGFRFNVRVDTDRFTLKAGDDGVVRERCWFCGQDLEFRPGDESGDVARVFVEPLGPGETMHGMCHTSCAQAAGPSSAG
jgi:hypothetical protein